MRRPMRAGDKIDGGDEYSRNMDMLSFISNFIGDDELSDRIYYLKPRDDTRPLIRKAMKRLGIKEEVELDEKFKVGDKVKANGFPGVITVVHTDVRKGMVDVKLKRGTTTVSMKDVQKEESVAEAMIR